MWNHQCILLTVAVLVLQAWTVQSQCKSRKELSGSISDKAGSYHSQGTDYRECWDIVVPTNHFLHFQVTSLKFRDLACNLAYVELKMTMADGTAETIQFCDTASGRKLYPIIRRPKTVKVTFFVYRSYSGSSAESSFYLDYSLRAGVTSVPGAEQARLDAIDRLKSKHTPFWGWRENTPRAVVALYLSSGADFDGTKLEEEMMAKQTELRTALALTWDEVTKEQLATFINGLLVTCLNPRHFYGHDLVELLRKKVEENGNFTHPTAYLALCNVNESWPLRAVEDMTKILSSNSDYPFVRDIQSFAIMAISCQKKRSSSFALNNKDLMSHYDSSINRFKKLQLPDGSFGNVYATALVTQAFLSNGLESDNTWNLPKAITYLLDKLNSTNYDFLTTYLTLPILNSKTLSDIATVNCSSNPRKDGDGDLVSEMNDYLGPKIRIQYSLYVGDNKEVIHTISLLVPKNATAYKVMQLAAAQDPKYEFKAKTIKGKMYVYEIAKIPNDSETGMFWLQYLKSKDGFNHLTSNPDQIVLDNNENLIMWFKTAEF